MALLSPDAFLRAAFGQVLLESDKQGVEANPIGTPSQSISKIDLLYEQRKIFCTSSNWRGSYLVFQSRMVFEGLTSYPTPISCLNALLLFDWLAGGWLLMAVAGWPGWLGWLAWLAGLAGLAGCWLGG